MSTLESRVAGTAAPDVAATLADLDDDARNLRFDELQLRMRPAWDSMRLDLEDESVVVIPSVSISRAVVGSSAR